MSTATLAGLLLIVMPVAFNVVFGMLAALFDYPDILRRPTDEVPSRFEAGGTGLVLLASTRRRAPSGREAQGPGKLVDPVLVQRSAPAPLFVNRGRHSMSSPRKTEQSHRE